MRATIILIGLLFAQSTLSAPAVPPSASPAAAPAAAGPASTKREGCRTSIAAQKLSGSARGEAMLVCLAEGRLDCTKSMVAAHTTPDKRKDYLRDCMGGAAR